MGVVYLARRRHRTVAVKVLRVDLASSDAFRTRFEREIAAARRITGQGVPALLDADARAVRPWFATEFVPGETLEAFVAEHGALDGPALRAFAVGVADALATIAQAGLVHRDLKPTNVLLTREGLTVLDLGVALDLEAVPLTRTGQRVGTRRWMAPEQVRGDRATPATDVFAWGVMVAYAASGGSPFGDDDTDTVLHRVMHVEPVLSALDPTLRPVVRQALAKEPAARPSIEHVLHVLLRAPADSSADRLHERARAVVAQLWPGDRVLTTLAIPRLPRSRRRIAGAAGIAAAAAVALVIVVPGADSSHAHGSRRAASTASTATTVATTALPTTTATPTTTTTTTAPSTSTTVDEAGALARAQDSVKRAGLVPVTAAPFNGTSRLDVVIAQNPTVAFGAFRAYFFVGGTPVGTYPAISSDDSRTLNLAAVGHDTITLTWSIYRPNDVGCCPTGGTAKVRFGWDGSKVVPLDPIPP